MKRSKRHFGGWGLIAPFVLVLVAAISAMPLQAEEVKGRWRIEANIGGVDPGDSIPSQSANRQRVRLNDGRFIWNEDPRPDVGATLDGRLSTDTRFEMRVSYGLAAWKNVELLLSAGVSSYNMGVDNIEVAYALDIRDPGWSLYQGNTEPRVEQTLAEFFPHVNPLLLQSFASDQGGGPGREVWTMEPVQAGLIEVIPVSVGATLRFRPTKRFNPYITVGGGYLFADYRASERWKEITRDLDRSLVRYTAGTNGVLTPNRVLGGRWRDIKQPEIRVPNSTFVEARVGAEWQWRSKTAIFTELGFFWAQDNITVEVDGRPRFGKPTPNFQVDEGDARRLFPLGGRPAYIGVGGLTTRVRLGANNFVVKQQPGEYYVNGGTLDYGGFIFTLGVRFTL